MDAGIDINMLSSGFNARMTPMRANIVGSSRRRDHDQGVPWPQAILPLILAATKFLISFCTFGLERIPDFRLMVLALGRKPRGKAT